MKEVAFAGCWHANKGPGVSAIVACAERGIKTLIHTGDFMYSMPVARRFVDALENQCAKHGVEIIVVRGNHDNPHLYRNHVIDTDERRAAGEDFGDDFARISKHILHAPDGLRWEWEGVRFGALGGARSIDWRGRISEESWWADEVTDWAAIESMKTQGDIDVLVMHDVPSRVPLRFADRNTMPYFWDLPSAEAHRVPLQEVVDATHAKYVMSGHMHAKQIEQMPGFVSVILDRGDYIPGYMSKAIMSRNMHVMRLDNGQVTLEEFI